LSLGSEKEYFPFPHVVPDETKNTRQKTFVLTVIDPEDVPFIVLSHSEILFVDQLINEKSYPQYIVITNTGRQPVEIKSVSTSGAFSVMKNCPFLEKGERCKISVFFTPTAEQKYAGILTIKSNAENGDQIIQLSGHGVTIPPEKELGLWTKSLNFGYQPLTIKTMDSSVWVANNSQLPIQIQDIRIDGYGFNLINHCENVINPRQSCQLEVSFNPQKSGEIIANLVIDSNADNSPHIIPLKGIGDRETTRPVIAELKLENISQNIIYNQAITVGHSFVQGDIPPGKTILANLDENDIQIQATHKSTHADGSLTLKTNQNAIIFKIIQLIETLISQAIAAPVTP